MKHTPVEFTAKALGLACRLCGPEMVETLISGGATFDFDLTPTLQRKKTNPRNKSSKADGGPDTEDFVFLLSLEEVEKYLPEEESRKTTFTDYAKGQYTGGSDRSGHWVLRTPGSDWGAVGVSDYFGSFSAMTGNFSGNRYIRPAIWVKTR